MSTSVLLFPRKCTRFTNMPRLNPPGGLKMVVVLRMSTQRTMPGGWADRGDLAKGTNGRNLCRWCNLEVPKGRLTFCSDWCVDEWRLRTDPGYLRQRVLDRDKGVCAVCRIDCL